MANKKTQQPTAEELERQADAFLEAAEKKENTPGYNGIMTAFAMAEQLRKIIMQQTHSNGQINKEYGSANITYKIIH